MGPELSPRNEPSSPGHARSRLPVEVFVAALLFLLALVLLPPWAQSGIGGRVLHDPGTGITQVEYARDLVREMMTWWLLPAMGLALVLRQGSIDLSVWAAFALGAAAAGRMIQAGCHPVGVLAGVVGVGLALGAIHAAAVARWRLPGWGVTLISATIGVSVAAGITGGKVVTVTMEQLDRWPRASHPALMPAAFCTLALLALAPLSLRSRLMHKPGPAGKLAAALIASAVLSCLGGLCWLLKSGQTCMPGHLVGDLRVLAAAVLAGAAAIRTRGRSLLVCAMVPPAVLVATVWWLFVWPTSAWPVEANLLALAAMAWAAHRAYAQALRPRSVRTVWPVLAGLGVVSLAATAATRIPGRDALRTALGLLLWLAGVGGAAVECLIRRKRNRARPQQPPQPLEPSS